jgi:tRNA modification GTPase
MSKKAADTIFALATPPGRSALAIVRVSGAHASEVTRLIIGWVPPPRVATLAKLRDPSSGKVIDHALVTWFPGPKTFTGEDCVEFSVHGSKAIIAKLSNVLGRFPSTRIAQAGEFTRRSLENGKIDLVGVEALGDLLSAETEQQRVLGIEGLSGAFQATVSDWRRRLLAMVVNVESSLDFADEHDVQVYDYLFIRDTCVQLCDLIGRWSRQYRRGVLLRNGFTILISGPPNAGKSSLMNELACRDVAIVSELPGTTRDLLEVHLDLGGYLVNIVDSAGLRETADRIETLGVQRALERAKTSNLVLWLCDHRENAPPPPQLDSALVWRVYTKCDAGKSSYEQIRAEADRGSSLCISVVSGYNLDELLARLTDFVSRNLDGEPDVVSINERQRVALERARQSLQDVIDGVETPEIVADRLREALHALEVLIGRIGVEDILSEIFSRFCIGK